MNSSDTNHSINADSGSDVHPDMNDLHLLSSSNKNLLSGGDNNATILHVAECLQCQKRLTLITSIKQSHHTIQDTAVSEVQQMLIVDYVHRGFSITRKKLLRQKIQDEPSSLKAMLHYASHSEAMRLNSKENMAAQKNRINADNAKVERPSITSHLIARISRLLMKLKLPFKWSFAFDFSTIYSMFVSLLFIGLLLTVLSDKLNPADIDASKNSPTLENNTDVEFEFIANGLNNSNGIYALDVEKNTSLKERREKGKVKIYLNEKNILHIGWPILESTPIYTLSFYPADNPTKTADLSVSTTGNFVELDVKNFESGTYYKWFFSYQTLNEKTFRAQGEFIIKTVAH